MNAHAHRVARRRAHHPRLVLPRGLVLPRALRVLGLAAGGTVAMMTLAESLAGRIG